MKKWALNKLREHWVRKYERASNKAYIIHKSILYAEREVVKIERLIESINSLEKTKREH